MDEADRDLQALDLVKAFMEVKDAKTRETILHLVKAAADGAKFEVTEQFLRDSSQRPFN